jgi:hypothetical protein
MPLVLVVSGGGGKEPRPVDAPEPHKVFYHGGLGFHRLEFGADSLVVQTLQGEDGTILHEKEYRKPL